MLAAQASNVLSALRVALLLLPDHFTTEVRPAWAAGTCRNINPHSHDTLVGELLLCVPPGQCHRTGSVPPPTLCLHYSR